MTDFDIQQISDDDLCNAGRRLQAAHDYIETNGFDISTYDGVSREAPCCYIGTVKRVGSESEYPALADDLSSEALVALSLLDGIATPPSDPLDGRVPGRLIELVEARALIEKPENWCQFVLNKERSNGAYAYCAVGALMVASGDREDCSGYYDRDEYNSRSHSCVIAAFDAAIEATA